eukprot:109741_1
MNRLKLKPYECLLKNYISKLHMEVMEPKQVILIPLITNTNNYKPKPDETNTLQHYDFCLFWQKIISVYAQSHHPTEIPSVLIALVSKYMVPMEYFTKCGSNLEIKEKDEYRLVSVTGYDVNTAFGAFLIPSTKPFIYQWHMHIKTRNSMMAIGIAATQFNDDTAAFHLNREHINYAYNSYSGYKCSKGNYVVFDSPCPSSGDVVMTLDLYDKSLSFAINNHESHVAYKDIEVCEDIVYRLCVAMRGMAVNGIDQTKNDIILKQFEVYYY